MSFTWSNAIEQGLALLLVAITYVMLGPRFALDLWKCCNSSQKAIDRYKSYMWGIFFQPWTAADFKLQLALAKGSEFSSSIFVAAGLIVLVASPVDVSSGSFRWQMVKTSACMLAGVSVIQAVSGAIRTSCLTSAQRQLEEFEEKNVHYDPYKALNNLQTHLRYKCVLKTSLGIIMAIPTISFWWMYRLAIITILLYVTLFFDTAVPLHVPWLTDFAVIFSAVMLMIAELYFMAYTYAASNIKAGLICGLHLNVQL